jgi:hypothetical protein
MLAEIFMLRLEGAARVALKTLPSSFSPFVPFTIDRRRTFKEDRKRRSEGTPEEPMARRDDTPDRHLP